VADLKTKTPEPMTQLLYGVPAAAIILGISPRLGWELVHSGELPSRRIRGRRLVHRRELEKFANKDHEG
jgi:excisionase family DNA binding protein